MYDFAPDKNAYFDYINNVQYWYDYYAHIFVTAVKNGATDAELKALAEDQEGAFIASMATGLHFVNRGNALKLVLDDLGIPNDLQIKHYYKDYQFRDERQGRQLALIDGYPTAMPTLQLTKDGRFCFYQWAKRFDPFVDVGIGIPSALAAFGVTGGSYDDVIGDPYSLRSAGWAKGSFAIKGRYSFNAELGINVVYGLKVIPSDKKLALEYVAAGRPGGMQWGGNGYPASNHEFYSQKTRQWIVSYKGEFYYAGVFWWDAVFIQVQYYLDLFLYVPYNVFDLVSYGTSYPEFFKSTFDDVNKLDHIQSFLSNVDFFVVPTGKIKFWDYVLLAAPVLITAVATIISAGASTPALVASLASSAGSLALKKALEQYKKSEMAVANQEALKDLTTSGENKLPGVDGDTGLPPGDKPVFEDQKYTWLWLIAGIGGVYLITKNKKR